MTESLPLLKAKLFVHNMGLPNLLKVHYLSHF